MLRSQPRAVRILGRKALSRQAKAAPLDGDGLRSSRAYYGSWAFYSAGRQSGPAGYCRLHTRPMGL